MLEMRITGQSIEQRRQVYKNRARNQFRRILDKHLAPDPQLYPDPNGDDDTVRVGVNNNIMVINNYYGDVTQTSVGCGNYAGGNNKIAVDGQ